MGLLSRVFGRAAVGMVAKEAGLDAGTLIGLISSGQRVSIRKTNTRMMLSAWETSPWFRSVVQRISFAAAVVPWRLFAVKAAPNSRQWHKGQTYIKHMPFQTGESLEVRSKIAQQLEAKGQLEEITDHKLFDILSEPNNVLTGVDMRLLTFASVAVAGESGWAIVRGDLNQPTEIWPVPPHWITRLPEAGYPYFDVTLAGFGEARRFGQDEFIFFKDPALANPYARGTGIGSTLADELETDEYIAKFQNTWFVNRGRPDIVFTVKPGTGGADRDINDLKAAKERFENEYRDVRRAGRSFWTRGDVDVKVLEQKLVDTGVIEQRTWIKDLVRETFGVPPEIMGDIKSSNRATITEAIAILSILSTVPQMERMRAQLQMQLIPMFDERLVLDYWSPVPDDREFKLKAMLAAPYAVELGEWRKVQGLDDRGDVDRVQMIPINLVPVRAPSLAAGDGSVSGGKEIKAMLGAHKKSLTDQEINEIVDILTPAHFDAEVTPEIRKTVQKWGDAVMADLGTEIAFDMVNPLVVTFLDKFSGESIKGINDTTKDYVREALQEGAMSGESADALARRITDLMDGFERMRALTIARTEVTEAANFGTWGAQKMSGLVPRRGWLATEDDRTRDAHVELDGQVVGIDEPFTVNGQSAMYPGGFADASLSVNCRCTTYGITDESKSMGRAKWVKSFIDETARDDQRVATAVRRVFRAQGESLVSALRRRVA